jgi:hypothetical protein
VRNPDRKRKVLSIIHIMCGMLICIVMAILFFFPGVIFYIAELAFKHFELPGTNDLISVITWLFEVITIVIFVYGLLLLMMAIPLFSLFIFLFVGLPSLIGGIGLYRNKTWGRGLLKFVSFLYLLIIPLGTILGIYSLETLKRINAYKATTLS